MYLCTEGGKRLTERELGQYQAYKRSIADLERRIEGERGREREYVRGKVKGSMRMHPYIETRFPVEMESPGLAAESTRRIEGWQREIAELRHKCREIEDFINSIKDPELRTIFRLRYIDGLKQREVAKKVNLDRSVISRKINNYLKEESNG